jgi:hypothetical protein
VKKCLLLNSQTISYGCLHIGVIVRKVYLINVTTADPQHAVFMDKMKVTVEDKT